MRAVVLDGLVRLQPCPYGAVAASAGQELCVRAERHAKMTLRSGVRLPYRDEGGTAGSLGALAGGCPPPVLW